jgi:hypothetical protein
MACLYMFGAKQLKGIRERPRPAESSDQLDPLAGTKLE